MIQLQCPRALHPLVSFTVGGLFGAPISQHARKDKCCIWSLKILGPSWRALFPPCMHVLVNSNDGGSAAFNARESRGLQGDVRMNKKASVTVI